MQPNCAKSLSGAAQLQKRAKLREELDIERYETDSEPEREEKQGKGKGVRVYQSKDAVTTVTVAPLILNSDEYVPQRL